MTDYTTMTLAELEAQQQTLATQRDAILTEQLAVQKAIDQKAIEVEAAAEVAEMSDEERQAMQQALNG